MASPDPLPEQPEWLPDSCYDQLSRSCEDLGEHAEVLELARLLCFSTVMKSYWRSNMGKHLARHSGELWNLAGCAATALRGENVPGGRGKVGADPSWFLRPRSDRQQLCERIESLARELRETIADTHFDQPTGMLLILGDVVDHDDDIRADGPSMTRVLDALGAHASASRAKVHDEPTFNATNDQHENFMIAILYRLHRVHFRLSDTAAQKRAGEVVAAVQGLAEPIQRGRLRNATRGKQVHR